ncbi:hypothetical protein HYU92_05010 [Candidatus Curtissbacteria bacterium]|nr:hypothetical protein [Candidatus Curtissbacteria bacterium]
MDPNQQAPQPAPEPIKATGANSYLKPYKGKGAIFFDNFLGGFAWSFGSLIGLALIAVFVGYLISQIDLIPIIGGFIAQIMQDATSRLQLPIQPIE